MLEAKISVQDIGSVKWYRNDTPLTASERVQMVVKGAKQRLVLTRTHASDEGHYKLMVGRADTSCRLSVQSKSNCGSAFSAVLETYGAACRPAVQSWRLQNRGGGGPTCVSLGFTSDPNGSWRGAPLERG